MKRHVFHGAVALAFSCAAPLLAQDLSDTNSPFDKATGASVNAAAFASGAPIQPMVGVSPESFAKDKPWYVVQDPSSLEFPQAPTVTRPWSFESQLRRNAAPFLKALGRSNQAGPTAMVSRTPARELNFALALLTAMYRADDAPAAKSSASDLEYALDIRHRIHKDPSKVLDIVTAEVNANPDRVCEIVKAAIRGVDNDEKQIPAIVEAAATAKPDAMRLAAQCAVAAVPESLSSVQAVLAKLDPASGESLADSKDCKDSKDAKDAKGIIDDEPAATRYDPLLLPPPPPPLIPIPPPPPSSTRTNFRYFHRDCE